MRGYLSLPNTSLLLVVKECDTYVLFHPDTLLSAQGALHIFLFAEWLLMASRAKISEGYNA